MKALAIAALSLFAASQAYAGNYAPRVPQYYTKPVLPPGPAPCLKCGGPDPGINATVNPAIKYTPLIIGRPYSR